jgi:hypothetical protein
MKRNFIFSPLILLITALFIITACKKDTTPPVITLIGSSPTETCYGFAYHDQGATAADNTDGDITSQIVTINSVDTNTVGTYTVTYNVSDKAGNKATEVIRTVIVKYCK